MSARGSGTRRLKSWIAAFEELLEGQPTPKRFTSWGAIAAISGALERRVWTVTANRKTYPNLFLLLTANPGVGKSIVIDKIEDLWLRTDNVVVGPKKLTQQALIDTYSESERTLNDGTHTMPLSIAAGEMGNFLQQYETGFMSLLSTVYDCPTGHSERLRGLGKIELKRPHLTLLGGIQPKLLRSLFPEDAFAQGFASRIIFVYSDETVKASLFGSNRDITKLEKDLINDLRLMTSLEGEFTFSRDAAQYLDEWHLNSHENEPDHPKLAYYNSRRILHVLKLSQIMSIDESNTLVIELSHVERALEYLYSAESEMANVFRDMETSEWHDMMMDTWNFVHQQHRATGEPVAENKIRARLTKTLPPREVDIVFKNMVASGWLEAAHKARTKAYKPGQVSA